MKILVILFVAQVLILGSLQAHGKRVFPQERQLLRDANLVPKVTAGPSDKVATQSKGAEINPETKAKNEADIAANNKVNEDVDGEDSSTTSHRYFADDQHQPANNNVNPPRRNP